MGGLALTWWVVLVILGHAALVGWGALVQARRSLLASLRERAHRAEAEQGRRIAEARMAERTRIAREMHDVLAHRLSLVATYAGALEYRPDAPPDQLARAALAALSRREHEVVVAVAKGQTNAEIAAELYMSVATVKAHISRILTKLSLGNRTQIALLAHDAGLA